MLTNLIYILQQESDGKFTDLKISPQEKIEPKHSQSMRRLAQLLNISKALELWSINNLYTQWVNFNVSMDAIIKYLSAYKNTTVSLLCVIPFMIPPISYATCFICRSVPCTLQVWRGGGTQKLTVPLSIRECKMGSGERAIKMFLHVPETEINSCGFDHVTGAQERENRLRKYTSSLIFTIAKYRVLRFILPQKRNGTGKRERTVVPAINIHLQRNLTETKMMNLFF